MINGGFTLGGKTAKELGLVMMGTSQRPGLPPTVDRTLSIPGRSGQWDYGADLGPRPFGLDCAAITQRAEALQTVVEGLARLLIDPYRRPRTLQLIFDTRPDRYFTVRYSGELEIDRIVGFGKFTLPLIAFDPFANAINEDIFEEVVTDSPHGISIQSSGDIRPSPIIVLSNEGSTTITHFTITNEYRME